MKELITLLLGGGAIGTLVAVVTLRSTAAKARAEARRAEAEAEGVAVNNAEQATRVLVENIVEPLREELNETRRYLQAAKREMARLRKAIDTASLCAHRDGCPVLMGLRRADDADADRADALGGLDPDADGGHGADDGIGRQRGKARRRSPPDADLDSGTAG